jgi:ribosome-associated protein
VANKKLKNITGKKGTAVKKPAPKKEAAKKAAPKKVFPAPSVKAPVVKAPALKVAAQTKTPIKKKTTAKQPKLKNLQEYIRDQVLEALDSGKAENVMCIDVREQSALTDFLVICSGRSTRQVKALSDSAQKTLYQCGAKQVRCEGAAAGDWAVVDGGDVIIHIFRPEVRSFYRLEEVWGLEPPLQETFKDL